VPLPNSPKLKKGPVTIVFQYCARDGRWIRLAMLDIGAFERSGLCSQPPYFVGLRKAGMPEE
jgi:hypothetical protein